MDQGTLAILLMLVGLALLVAEVFIPSGGFILVLAIICFTGSVLSAWQAWWHDSRGVWWAYLASLLFLLPTVLSGALWVLPRTELGRRFLPEPPTLEEVTPYNAEELRMRQMVGHVGKALTLLSPGGLVLVDGDRMHSESEGLLIEPGQDVVVVAVRGNRLVVRPWDGKSPPPQNAGESEDDTTSGKSPLDFDFPQS